MTEHLSESSESVPAIPSPSDILNEIYWDFIEDGFHGIVRISPPTGSGKTYSFEVFAASYTEMVEKKGLQPRQILFTASRRADLNNVYENIASMLRDKGLDPKNKILKLDADGSIIEELASPSGNGEKKRNYISKQIGVLPAMLGTSGRVPHPKLALDIEQVKADWETLTEDFSIWNIARRAGEKNAADNALEQARNAKRSLSASLNALIADMLNPKYGYSKTACPSPESNEYRERVDSIMDNPHMSWVHVLFPAIDLHRRDIILTTSHKFQYRLQRPGYSERDFAAAMRPEPIVFFDEIDKMKEALQEMIAQDAARDDGIRDVIGCMQTVCDRLTELETDPMQKENKLTPALIRHHRSAASEVLALYDSIRQITIAAMDKINARRYFTFSGEQIATAQIYAFTSSYYSTSTTRSLCVRLNRDEGSSASNIVMEKKEYAEKYGGAEVADENQDQPSCLSIHYIVGVIRRWLRELNHHIDCIAKIMSDIEKDDHALRSKPALKQEIDGRAPETSQKPIAPPPLHTEEQLRRTCLSTLGLSNPAIERSLQNFRSIKTSPFKSRRLEDDTYYARGFTYSTVKENPDNVATVEFTAQSMISSPEAVLVNYLEKSNATAFGLSATASIESPLCNFNFEGYLNVYHPDRMGILSKAQTSSLARAVEEADRGYDRVSTDIVKIRSASSTSMLMGLCTNGRNQGTISDETYRRFVPVGISGQESKIDFRTVRMGKLAAAMDAFMISDDLECGLFMLNTAISRYDPRGGAPRPQKAPTFEEVEEIGTAIAVKHGLDPKAFSYKTYRTSEYAKVWNEVCRDIANGLRVLVFTSFGSAGDGVNMKIPLIGKVPDRYVSIGHRAPDEESDVPFAYYETKTNAGIPDFEKKEAGAERTAKLFMQCAYLNELAFIGDISVDEARRQTSRRIAICQNPRALKQENTGNDNLIHTQSARRKATKQLVQAVGRLHRCNMRHKHQVIAVESDLDTKIDIQCLSNPDFIPTPEIAAIAQAFSIPMEDQSSRELRYANRASVISNSLRQVITAICDSAQWSDATVERYEAIRQETLKHPTATVNEANAIVRKLWALAPERTKSYLFSERGDFMETAISFKPDGECEIKSTIMARERNVTWSPIKTVSQGASRLGRLLTCKEVRQFFQERGYALEWKEGDYILTPYANVLYLGALGEASFEAAFRYFFGPEGYRLADLEMEIYEVADFAIERKGDRIPLYIDAKHRLTDVDNTKVYEHKLRSKVDRLDADLIIVNFLRDGIAANAVIAEQEYRLPSNRAHTVTTIPWLWDADAGKWNHEAIAAIHGKLQEV